MSTVPRVSVVVACYKYAHFLPTCLDSILQQTFRDFELLLLDDCSPDNTPEVVAQYTDPRIRYVRHPKNLGLAGNLNTGMPLARGELFWLISADDAFYDNTALARAVSLFDANPDAGMVWSMGVRLSQAQERLTQFAHWEEERKFARGELAVELAEKCIVCTPAAMVRRSIYHAVGLFPKDLPYIGDWYQWLRYNLLAGAVYTPTPLARYRLHDANMTAAFTHKSLDRFMRECLIYRLWMQRMRPEFPAVAERARSLSHYDFRFFFQAWVQTRQRHDVAIAFVHDARQCADAIAAPGETCRPAFRDCLHEVASALLSELWKSRRLKSVWRAWRLRAALDRALAS